jgi:hypothetical protein
LLSEDDAYFPHEPDHVIAMKHGGLTVEGNLALACLDCNRFKGSDIASLDPETGALTPLFNPRSDAWAAHFSTAEGLVVARTGVARATVALLRVNAPTRVEIREALAALHRWPEDPAASL